MRLRNSSPQKTATAAKGEGVHQAILKIPLDTTYAVLLEHQAKGYCKQTSTISISTICCLPSHSLLCLTCQGKAKELQSSSMIL